MSSNIKAFLKFGKREHLQSLVEGNLYCSNAKTFWGIEDNLKIKGQGDILEAGSRMFASKMIVQDTESNHILAINGQSRGLVRVEPAECMPVFCLFSVYDEDCCIDVDGRVNIQLSAEKKQMIAEHFPHADSAVLINNPDQFIEDIVNSIGRDVKTDCVHYFNLDKGYRREDGQVAMDMRYMKYLTQDQEPEKVNGVLRYLFYADYAYRVLFCKDEYFTNEQEFRIVLPGEKIEEGKAYPIKLSSEYIVQDISNFI